MLFRSPTSAQGFQFLYIFTNTSLFSFLFVCFASSHPKVCEVISHCDFNLNFPSDQQCWAFFPVLIGHLYIFFGVLYPVFNWVIWGFFLLLICRVLYIFWILTPYQIYDLQTFFSQKVAFSLCQLCPLKHRSF